MQSSRSSCQLYGSSWTLAFSMLFKVFCRCSVCLLPSGWYAVDRVLVISTLRVKVSCPYLTTFLPLMLGKLLLVALTVYTVPRFPLLPDLSVGAPYHSVSSILANEWQPIYNWVHISILGLSLHHIFFASFCFHCYTVYRWLSLPVVL